MKECTLRQLSKMDRITIENDLEPDSRRWDYSIRYTKPDWYSLYSDQYEEGGFYRGEFPTFCRIKITEL
jgi:hypothetical protein